MLLCGYKYFYGECFERSYGDSDHNTINFIYENFFLNLNWILFILRMYESRRYNIISFLKE